MCACACVCGACACVCVSEHACAPLHYTDDQYSARAKASAVVGVWSTSKCAPRFVPANRRSMFLRALILFECWDKCFVLVRNLSSVTARYLR